MAWASGSGIAPSAGGTWQSGAIYRRALYGSYGIANTTVRDLAIKSIAAGPGIVDPLLLKQWAIAEGVAWP